MVSLPLVQPIANAQGFGDAWRGLLEKRTQAAAASVWAAAEAASKAWPIINPCKLLADLIAADVPLELRVDMHTCPYKVELYDDETLCDCSPEKTRECLYDI